MNAAVDRFERPCCGAVPAAAAARPGDGGYAAAVGHAAGDGYAAGGGSSATRRMDTVSSSSWKCGRRNTVAL